MLIALTTPSDMGNRGCSDAFGRSLAYIREHLTDPIRVEELLAATDMSVTEIAFRYGFSSSQYFATVFKRLCCSTPTQYRRMMKKCRIPSDTDRK